MKKQWILLLLSGWFVTVSANSERTLNTGWNLYAHSGSTQTVESLFGESLSSISSLLLPNSQGEGGSLIALSNSDLLQPHTTAWVYTTQPVTLQMPADQAGEFDPSSWQPGWQLLAFDSTITSLETLEQAILQADSPYAPMRLLSLSAEGWSEADLWNNRGTLTSLQSDHGYWVYLGHKVTIASGSQTGTAGDTQLELADGIKAQFYTATATDSTVTTAVTLSINGVDYPLTLPTVSADYQLKIWGAEGQLLSRQQGSERFTLVTQSAARILPVISIWGLDSDGYSTQLTDQATLRTTEGSLSTIAIEEGLQLLEEVDSGTSILIDHPNYLTSTVTVDTEQLYVTLQQEDQREELLLAEDADSVLPRPLTRTLNASPAAAAPSSARHNADVGLLFDTGRVNPNQSISITLSPITTLDSISDQRGLESIVRADYLSDTGTDTTAQNIDWSMGIIGGGIVTVKEMSSGEPLTLQQRSAAALGAFAGISPYLARPISGEMAEVRARLLQNDEETSLRKVQLTAYAYTPNGWARIADTVDIIDPTAVIDSEDTELMSRGYSNADSDSRPESTTILHKLPLDGLVLTTATSADHDGRLMAKENTVEGGLYDFIFVMTELEAKSIDVTIRVVDRDSGEALPGAQVRLESGQEGITAEDGRVTLRRIVVPSTRAFITAEALRYDHYRSAIPLNFAFFEGEEETIQLRKVEPHATLSGNVTNTAGLNLEAAEVTLQLPQALSKLRGSIATGEITLPQDARASYTWKARPAAASSWQTVINASTVEEEGNRLTLQSLQHWLAEKVLIEGENLPLLGEYQLQTTIAYDMDQNGTVDYSEQSEQGSMVIQLALSPSLFTMTSSLDTINQTLRQTAGNFGIFGSPQLGLLRLFGGGEGITFHWGLDLRWNGGDQTRYLTTSAAGRYEWSATEPDNLASPLIQLNSGDPTRLMGWESIVMALSSTAMAEALLEQTATSTETDISRYLDGNGSDQGLQLRLNISAMRSGERLHTGTVRFRSNVSSAAHPGSTIATRGLSVIAPPGELYRTTMTDSDGNYQFTKIDSVLGGEGLPLSHSLLRVKAEKFGFEEGSWRNVPKFGSDNQTTESQREDLIQQDLTLNTLPTRDLRILVKGTSHPGGIAGASVSIADLRTALTDTEGYAQFEALPTGDHPLQITLPEEFPVQYALHQETIQLEPWYDFGDQEEPLQQTTVILAEAGWRSPALPKIELTISEPFIDGSVLVEGQILEMRKTNTDWNWVPYGFDSNSGDNGARVRNGVRLRFNGQPLPITLSDTGDSDQLSTFRERVTLEPGRNQLQLEATNHNGKKLSEVLERNYQITTGSLSGTLRLQSATGEAAANATIFLRDGDGKMHQSNADAQGDFLLTWIPVGTAELMARAEINGIHYLLSTPATLQLQEATRSDTGTLVLNRLAEGVTLKNGAPVIRLNGAPDVNAGVLTLSGKVGNFDGLGIDGTPRTAILLLEGKESLTAEVTAPDQTESADHWNFSFKLQLPQQNNRVTVRAINLNGSESTSTELLIHKAEQGSRVLSDMAFTVQGLIVGEQVRIELYDGVSGNPILYQERVAEQEEMSITLDLLDLGHYYYELKTESAALRTGTFELTVTENSVVLETPLPLMESRYLRFKSGTENLSISRIGTSRVAEVSGIVQVRVPRAELDSITRFGAELEVVIAGRPPEKIELPSRLLEDLGTAHNQISFRTYEIPFSTTVALRAGINRMHVRLRAKGENIDTQPTSIIIADENSIGDDVLTITLDWQSGADMDLISIYYPDWPAYADVSRVKLSPIQALVEDSYKNRQMVRLDQSTPEQAGMGEPQGVPEGHQLRLYVDDYKNKLLSQTITLTAGVADASGIDCFETISVAVDKEYVNDYLVMELLRQQDKAKEYLEVDPLPSTDSCTGNFYYSSPTKLYTLQAQVSPLEPPDSKRFKGVEVMDLDYQGDPSTDDDAQPEHHFWATDNGRVGDGTYIIYVRDNGPDGAGFRVRLQGAGLGDLSTGRFDLHNSSSQIDMQAIYLLQVESHAVVRLLAIPVGSTVSEVIDPLPSDQGGFVIEPNNSSSRMLHRFKLQH